MEGSGSAEGFGVRLHYSVAAELGSGIGLTAEKQIVGAEAAGWSVVRRSLTEVGELAGMVSVEKDNVFDAVSALKMDRHDVFHGWSQHSLFQMLRSQKLGAGVVLQRASHHIVFQRQVLEEEFRRHGVTGEVVPELAVRKELLEYDEADVVVVPSESCKESFDRYGVGEKVRVAGFGVDSKYFRPREKRGKGFTALFVGGNVVRKGLRYALEGWRRAGVDGRFLVGGHESVPYPASRGVVATGFVEDVRDLYGEADVFVLPSLEEGQSLAVWEALAMGVPVVVSTRCGFNDVVTDGVEGFVVEPGDVDGIAEAIEVLVVDGELREEMGVRARELAERFPWRRHQEELVEIWRGVAGD